MGSGRVSCWNRCLIRNSGEALNGPALGAESRGSEDPDGPDGRLRHPPMMSGSWVLCSAKALLDDWRWRRVQREVTRWGHMLRNVSLSCGVPFLHRRGLQLLACPPKLSSTNPTRSDTDAAALKPERARPSVLNLVTLTTFQLSKSLLQPWN